MTYLYIHGFGSSGLGIKARLFREYFGASLIAPSLSFIPDLAIDTLDQLIHFIKANDDIALIGSSLGGYYATYLAERHNLKAILINPSVKPYETLAAMEGNALSYYDLCRFEWNDHHIAMLKSYDTKSVTHERYCVLLQTGDEVLDYREAERKFNGSLVDIEEGGTHGFEGIERKLELIRAFVS